MRPLTSLALLGLAVGCSPAAPPVEAPKPPPPVTPAPKPEQTHATWSFPSAGGRVQAQVDLGERGILQVGERGRRWLFAKGESEPKQAPTIVPQDLVDGRVEGAQVLLLGEQGAVYLAKEPLGAIETTRPGPKDHKAIAFRSGKQALLGVDKTGTLYRSTDVGVTWGTSKLPMRVGDVVVGLAANKRGEALALIRPQRVLVSTDDGATWTPVATPGIGARSVARHGTDDLFLEGVAKDRYAKLANGKLEVAAPTPWVERKGAADRPARQEIAGSRVVTVIETPDPKASQKMKVEVAVGAFGKAAGPASVLEPAAQRWATRVVVSGYENTVVVGVHDERADPPTTKLVRTSDDGKTWEQLGTLAGRIAYDFRVYVGPGQILVGEVCDDEAKTCKPAQLKSGSKPWQDIVLPPKTNIEAVQLDPAHDRAWLVGTTGDSAALFAGKLSEGTFTLTGVELPRSTPNAMTIDGKGWLRLVYTSPTRVVRVASDFGVHPALYAPFNAHGIGFAGERGFAYDGDDGWETADGGEKWSKVPIGAGGEVTCSEGGCLQGGAIRVGWDLPDPAKELVAASTEPPKKKDSDDAPPPPPKATTESPLKLACTASGAWKPFEANPYQIKTALDGDVRLLAPTPSSDGSSSVIVARGNGAPTKIALLAASPKRKPDDPTRERSWTDRSNEGYVSVRYSYTAGKSEDGKYAPVDVELAWYSAASGKTTKTKLAKVSPFRVGRAAPSALHAIVEGGLLFLPNSGDAPLTFVKDGGKTETIPRPPESDQGSWSDALKHGNQIVLVRQRSGDVTFALTKDAGKTWSTTSWSLGAPVTVGMLDGKITLAMRQSLYSSGAPVALFTFESLTNDPPDALRLDTAKLGLGSALVACTPKTRLGLATEIPRSKERRGMTLTLAADKPAKGPVTEVSGPTTLTLTRLVDRIDASGNVCNDGVELEKVGGGSVAAMLAPHDLAHGWLVRSQSSAWSKIEMRPLSCKPE